MIYALLALFRRRRERQWYTCPACGNVQSQHGFCGNDYCPEPLSIVVPD